MRLQLTALVVIALSPAPSWGQDAQRATRIATDLLLYSDTDSVMVASPQLAAHHALDDDGGEVSARVVLDAITAASVDVISNATPRFSELRSEVGFGLSKSIDNSLPSLSYRYSDEPDYRSHGFGVGLQQRFAGGDTVAALSYHLTADTIGRVDTPADIFSERLRTHAAELGVTQILGENTLMRAVYTLTSQRGYMEKPYRSVPIFDEAGLTRARADGVALDLDTFDDYRLPFKPPEEVPDRRHRHAFALRGLRYLPALDASLRVDYRLYGDTWGIVAHTAEPAVFKALGDDWRIELKTRLHVQSSADFWQRTYVVESPTAVPSLRTTDRSLSKIWQSTTGARLEWSSGRWGAYLALDGMYTRFLDHLLLRSRFALMAQGGLRCAF